MSTANVFACQSAGEGEWQDDHFCYNKGMALSACSIQIDYQFSYLNLAILLYTHVTSKCRIQLELETSLGKALIEENGCSPCRNQ